MSTTTLQFLNGDIWYTDLCDVHAIQALVATQLAVAPHTVCMIALETLKYMVFIDPFVLHLKISVQNKQLFHASPFVATTTNPSILAYMIENHLSEQYLAQNEMCSYGVDHFETLWEKYNTRVGLMMNSSDAVVDKLLNQLETYETLNELVYLANNKNARVIQFVETYCQATFDKLCNELCVVDFKRLCSRLHENGSALGIEMLHRRGGKFENFIPLMIVQTPNSPLVAASIRTYMDKLCWRQIMSVDNLSDPELLSWCIDQHRGSSYLLPAKFVMNPHDLVVDYLLSNPVHITASFAQNPHPRAVDFVIQNIERFALSDCCINPSLTMIDFVCERVDDPDILGFGCDLNNNPEFATKVFAKYGTQNRHVSQVLYALRKNAHVKIVFDS